jgi:DNA gyrase subunit A
MLFSDAGKVVRFHEQQVRSMGRTATGVRGIKLQDEQRVVSLIVPRGDGEILTATVNGYGKRTPLEEYPAKSRATQGVVSIKVSERNGEVVGAVQVEDSHEIMLISDQGTLVRTRVSEVSVISRNTAGVRLIRTVTNEHVVGLEPIAEVSEDLIEGELADEAATTDGADSSSNNETDD